MPSATACPKPFVESWFAISYIRVPLLEKSATAPGLNEVAGIIPSFISLEGMMSPGVFGPITVAPMRLRELDELELVPESGRARLWPRRA